MQKTILIRIKSTKFDKAWYSEFIDMEFEVTEHKTDNRFYVVPSTELTETWLTYLIYKCDCEILEQIYIKSNENELLKANVMQMSLL